MFIPILNTSYKSSSYHTVCQWGFLFFKLYCGCKDDHDIDKEINIATMSIGRAPMRNLRFDSGIGHRQKPYKVL